MRVVFALSFLSRDSNAWEKSTNNNEATRFFARTPTMIRQSESVKLWIDFTENSTDFS